LRERTWVHWPLTAMAFFTLLFPLALPLLLLFSLLGARTRLISSRLPALMMAFFLLLTSTPVFLPHLTSGDRALPPRARVRLRRLLLHPFLVRHPRFLGRIPFPFLPSPLPTFVHILLISLLSLHLFLFPPPISTRAVCVTSVSFCPPSSSRFTFVKSHSAT